MALFWLLVRSHKIGEKCIVFFIPLSMVAYLENLKKNLNSVCLGTDVKKFWNILSLWAELYVLIVCLPPTVAALSAQEVLLF